MPVEAYDILVLGSGVAGAAAALVAARSGARIGLVSRDRPAAPWWDWLHPAAAADLSNAGVRVVDIASGRIDQLSFLSADLNRRAACDIKEAPVIIQRNALRHAIRHAAAAAGAAHHADCAIASAAAGEDAVCLTAQDGRTFSGRVLIAADGAESAISRHLRAVDTSVDPAGFHAAQWHLARRRGAAPKKSPAPALVVILATSGPTGFGYILDTPHGPVAGLVERGPSEAVSARLLEHLPRWADRQLLPPLDVAAGSLAVRRVPRGAALDQDSHVGKRTLFIGDCGGFVCSLSQEGLLPAVRSAALAIDVAIRALKERHEQDVLAEFDSVWRSALADTLRLPSTDFQFLMPLVFSNSAIAKRMARAFLLCENL